MSALNQECFVDFRIYYQCKIRDSSDQFVDLAYMTLSLYSFKKTRKVTNDRFSNHTPSAE